MILLDEIVSELEAFKKYFDIDIDDTSEMDAYHAYANHVSAMQEIINKHSQPLTPEQVVEWWELEWKGDANSYHIDCFSLELIGLHWFIHVLEEDEETDDLSSQGFPLSRFRNLDELKSFVRILTGEEV